MAVTTTIQHRRSNRQKHPELHNRPTAIDHAVRVINRVCCLAGSANLIDRIRVDLDADGVRAAMRNRDTAAVFDWLIASLSYQGISDQIAFDYMEEHGYVRWQDVNQKLAQGATCPKLKSYWHFYGCAYQKLSRTWRKVVLVEPNLESGRFRIGRCQQPAFQLARRFGVLA
jgi:hypothetical protein